MKILFSMLKVVILLLKCYYDIFGDTVDDTSHKEMLDEQDQIAAVLEEMTLNNKETSGILKSFIIVYSDIIIVHVVSTR